MKANECQCKCGCDALLEGGEREDDALCWQCHDRSKSKNFIATEHGEK